MIEENVKQEILARLAKAERDHDARFIYVNRPDWYLSVGLEEQRDVIEYPIIDDLDVNGWDLRKALRLFWKSNPAFIEWIQSPIVYTQRGDFAEQCRALTPEVYSTESGIYHYRSMAKTNFRGYLQDELVPLKKYFYVLRPLLAVRWLERYGNPAPIEFHKLLETLGDDRPVLNAIDELLEKKRGSPELGLSPQVPAIQNFIVNELVRVESITPARFERKNVEPKLSALFRRILTEAWA